MRKLIMGIVDFRERMLPQYARRFRSLALAQSPDALFIAPKLEKWLYHADPAAVRLEHEGAIRSCIRTTSCRSSTCWCSSST